MRTFVSWRRHSCLPAPRLLSALFACIEDTARQECRARQAEACATSVAVLLLVTAGCGFISSPLVPLANVPAKIPDLAAVQRGATLIVHCTVPTLTTENNPLKTAPSLDLRIGATGGKFDSGAWPGQAKPITPFETKDGLVNFRIPTQEWVGKEVAIGVRAVGSNKKPSEWSNFEILTVVPPPETPSQPEVQDTAVGNRVTWTGRGDQFRVLRRIGDEKEYTIAVTVAGHEWTDAGVDYTKPYTYMVQALVDAGNKKFAESDLSEPRAWTPVDRFPPAVPTGLRADRLANAVSLVWEPDTDSDLAGYRVYRSEGNGPWQKLADVNVVPSYSDTTVEHGKTYRYAVSAFDKAAKVNESERSAAVEILFP